MATAMDEARQLPNTYVAVPDDEPETVLDGNSWLSPVLGLSASQDGGFSVDVRISVASGSPVVTATLHGGNFRRASGAFPELEYDAADLPDLSSLPVSAVFNFSNARVNFAQLELAVAGGDVLIEYAVAKVSP